ncbi:MAG: molybdate ABC transporter substrate-binding protein [Desulfovibrionaceae bacterium]
MHRSWRSVLLLSALLLAILPPAPVRAEGDALVLASGAGYKQMVNALVKAYGAETGKTVDLVYGNMAQVTGQVRAGGVVDLVVGAEFFLSDPALGLAEPVELGRGRLVLAWPKGRSAMMTDRGTVDLNAESVRRIALPDPVKAIYGKAAMEYLKSSGQYEAVQAKLTPVATVPQVFAYLVADEVDLGFMNLTHVLGVKDQLGGWKEMPLDGYEPIRINAYPLRNAPHAAALADFLRFLGTDAAREIVRANGL